MGQLAGITSVQNGVTQPPALPQAIALCFRTTKKKVQVLLVTSRGTGRWLLPKGWQVPGKSLAESAAQEAWEEAGAKGQAEDVLLGSFAYFKWQDDRRFVPCIGHVYPLHVKGLADKFPEAGQRRRKWFGLKKAASKLDDPELARIVLAFDPKKLKAGTA